MVCNEWMFLSAVLACWSIWDVGVGVLSSTGWSTVLLLQCDHFLCLHLLHHCHHVLHKFRFPSNYGVGGFGWFFDVIGMLSRLHLTEELKGFLILFFNGGGVFLLG